MFLEKQPKNQIDYYKKLLNIIGSLSNLSSESNEPFLHYRVVENLFCKAFDAENLSRSDASADASKDELGFGIKTFLEKNGNTLQKIAEFNNEHQMFRSLGIEEKIIKIAQLRNERIKATKRIFKLNDLIYHCITRENGLINVYETPAPTINIDKIEKIQVSSNGNTVQFFDPSDEYSFNITKSTLYKRFKTNNILLKVPVKILSDPFSVLEKLVSESGLVFSPVKVQPHIFLPLYSYTTGKGKYVPEKSGLNQWNAAGRLRDPNEIYIPIPSWIHTKFPKFFPPRDKSFELMLPNRETISAKVCQDNSKALMTNPNAALGKWLLRDVLDLPEKVLLTYNKLYDIGLDSVVIYKIDSGHYDIDFTKIGSFNDFETTHLKNENDIQFISNDDED